MDSCSSNGIASEATDDLFEERRDFVFFNLMSLFCGRGKDDGR